ncbi:MAG: hypothetical protein DA405_13245 [Bacteroidetes bacterium]|nr:MAG: hypothetical protein DA405_13245 [Bacteroidota bacterium]
MKIIKISTCLVLFSLITNLAWGQQIPLYSNYFFTPFIFNPAMSGSSEVTEATFLHRRQWTGIQGSPETSAIAIDGSINNEKVGWSIYAFSDKTDILSRLGLYGNYAYHVKLSEKVLLSGGIGAGYINQNIEVSAIRAPDLNDVFNTITPSRGSFDINIGLKLKITNFTLGFAAPQLLSQNVTYASKPSPIIYNLIRHYVASSYYDINLQGKEITLSPTLLFRTAQSVPSQVDAGLIFKSKKYGFLGAMFRSDYAITVNAGINLSENLTLGYAYDFSTSNYSTAFGSSNEFMLTYRFSQNQDYKKLEKEIKELEKKINVKQNELNDNDQPIDEQTEEGTEKLEPSNTGNSNNQYSKNKSYPSDYLSNHYGTKYSPGEPGYYLIAGVYRNKANADRFIESLAADNIKAKIYLDSDSQYFYVFLLRLDTYIEADEAQYSKLFGQYTGDMWIKIIK